jgi:hypothetical protein
VVIPALNIAIGAALALGGATGRLTFIGTNSSGLLIAAGAVIAGIGIIQLVKAARGR